MQLILPPTANVPREWVRRRTLTEEVLVVPAWGTAGAKEYEVTVDLETRAEGGGEPSPAKEE